MVSCRIHTQLEIASEGLSVNKTKSLDWCYKEDKGRGVVATELIRSGEFVCEYKYSSAYPMKKKHEVEKCYEANGQGCFILEVQAPGGKKICLDATNNLQSWGRFINHGSPREANVKPFRPLIIRGKLRVAFLAIRDIHAGVELLYDYGQRRDCPEWMKRRRKVHHWWVVLQPRTIVG